MNKRVLHLIHSDQRRGAEMFAAELAANLESIGGFSNGICTLYPGQKQGLTVGDLPIFRLDQKSASLKRLGMDPVLLYRLVETLKDYQPDVMVAHGSDTLKYSSCASVFYRKPAVVYRNIGTASIWANSPFKVGLNRMFLQRMNTVVSVSEYTRQDFIKVYGLPEQKVALIPNGVDTAPFETNRSDDVRQQVRQELGLSETDVVLISVGNLSSEKGHTKLLEVIDDLIGSGIDFRLLMVGSGPLLGQLEVQAREAGLDSVVHFLGTRNDVPRLMASADIFVLPSQTEGMPAVLIEAGMAGLPSVAFDVGGVAEVVETGSTGYLVAAGDGDGFRAALSKLCRDREIRARMGKTALQRCREQFDMRKVAEEYRDLFFNMLDFSRKGNGKS